MRASRALGLAVPLAAICGAAWLSLAPLDGADLASHPAPARDYDQALRRIEELSAADTESVNAVCHTRLFTHGQRTGRVIVLLHGLTNCPQQFDSLGHLLFERGANVLIARLPHHGMADRLTRELGKLQAAEVVRFSDEVVDIARGLGDSVTVAGLSLGGVMAAWIAQEREDVDRAVLIAPVFGVQMVQPVLTGAVTRLALALPDRLEWWDSKLRDKLPGPPYAYPRFSTRALAATLRIGQAVMEQARRSPMRAASAVLVTVGGDDAIRNEMVAQVARSWERYAPGRVTTYEFPESQHVGHDMIDPLQPYQRVALTYPELARWMWR